MGGRYCHHVILAYMRRFYSPSFYCRAILECVENHLLEERRATQWVHDLMFSPSEPTHTLSGYSRLSGSARTAWYNWTEGRRGISGSHWTAWYSWWQGCNWGARRGRSRGGERSHGTQGEERPPWTQGTERRHCKQALGDMLYPIMCVWMLQSQNTEVRRWL